MRLVHALFNDALPLMIIIMDSALGTGDKSVSEQYDLKPQRSHLGREVRKWPGGLSSSVSQATSQRHLCGCGGISDAGIRSCSRSHLDPHPRAEPEAEADDGLAVHLGKPTHLAFAVEVLPRGRNAHTGHCPSVAASPTFIRGTTGPCTGFLPVLCLFPWVPPSSFPDHISK